MGGGVCAERGPRGCGVSRDVAGRLRAGWAWPRPEVAVLLLLKRGRALFKINR